MDQYILPVEQFKIYLLTHQSGNDFLGRRTPPKWNERITLSSSYCTYLPPRTRVALSADELIKTITVTLKSAQAVVSLNSLLADDASESNSGEDRFLPTFYWASRAFRAVFLLLIIGLFAMCLVLLVPPSGGKQYTVASFFASLFYLIILSLINDPNSA
ncbi:hypothetical protein F4814DRAFT_449493 [Daldinia grandis]|nr:hypothetical protein F4814DRAFT_449493 [Daldinia grandis]